MPYLPSGRYDVTLAYDLNLPTPPAITVNLTG
jgi:hypothetical protein